MSSTMEGNQQLAQKALDEKHVVDGGARSVKRTFLVNARLGVAIDKPVSTDEELLERNRKQFTSMELLRGVWREKRGERWTSSGTYFPLAAPAGGKVTWVSAGHCLMATDNWEWRCGYGTEVRPIMGYSCAAVPDIVKLDWLTNGVDKESLAEHVPSQPGVRIADADVQPDFRFMRLDVPEGEVKQLFIPSARQLKGGEAICVLGFAHPLTAEWARTYLCTEADYLEAVAKVKPGEQPRPAEGFRLDDEKTLCRMLDLDGRVCFPSFLVASPGLVTAATARIIEHGCTTYPGMSGAPGVDMDKPWQLLFIHTRSDANIRRGNYGISVHHPLFVKAYEREVLPSLLITPSHLLPVEKLRCLHEYLTAVTDKLDDATVLHQVEQRIQEASGHVRSTMAAEREPRLP